MKQTEPKAPDPPPCRPQCAEASRLQPEGAMADLLLPNTEEGEPAQLTPSNVSTLSDLLNVKSTVIYHLQHWVSYVLVQWHDRSTASREGAGIKHV